MPKPNPKTVKLAKDISEMPVSLLLSAPDLLEALQVLVDSISDCPPNTMIGAAVDRCLLVKAQAAIAKAQGR
jgi:hypothetical protein